MVCSGIPRGTAAVGRNPGFTATVEPYALHMDLTRPGPMLLTATACAGSERLVPLEVEVALVRRYLAIEQVRFGDRLRPSVSVAPDARDAQVPPLILQPLIENAVRHGIATLIEGGDVTVDLRTEGDRTVAVIDNPFDPDGRRPGTGIGLTNVRARLTALYGPRASLAAGASGERYRVRVEIPMEAA